MRIPMRFQRRGGRKRIVAPDGSEVVLTSKPQPDGTLMKALTRAWRWQRMLDARVYSSVTEISEAEAIGKSYVSRILRLALLAPDVVEEILEGRARDALMLKKLERRLPASWVEQRSLLLALAGRGVRPATSEHGPRAAISRHGSPPSASPGPSPATPRDACEAHDFARKHSPTSTGSDEAAA